MAGPGHVTARWNRGHHIRVMPAFVVAEFAIPARRDDVFGISSVRLRRSGFRYKFEDTLSVSVRLPSSRAQAEGSSRPKPGCARWLVLPAPVFALSVSSECSVANWPTQTSEFQPQRSPRSERKTLEVNGRQRGVEVWKLVIFPSQCPRSSRWQIVLLAPFFASIWRFPVFLSQTCPQVMPACSSILGGVLGPAGRTNPQSPGKKIWIP